MERLASKQFCVSCKVHSCRICQPVRMTPRDCLPHCMSRGTPSGSALPDTIERFTVSAPHARHESSPLLRSVTVRSASGVPFPCWAHTPTAAGNRGKTRHTTPSCHQGSSIWSDDAAGLEPMRVCPCWPLLLPMLHLQWPFRQMQGAADCCE